MKQRTDEWFAARAGKVTASRIADLMARTRTGFGASRGNYMAELLCERLTGVPADRYTNAAMEWGPTSTSSKCNSRWLVRVGISAISPVSIRAFRPTCNCG